MSSGNNIYVITELLHYVITCSGLLVTHNVTASKGIMVWWRWSAGKTVEDMVLVSQRFIICHRCLHCRKVLARRCTGCVRSDRGFRCLVVFQKLLVRWQSFNGMAAWQLYANTHHRLPTLVWFTCALHYAQIFWQNRSKKKKERTQPRKLRLTDFRVRISAPVWHLKESVGKHFTSHNLLFFYFF